MFTSPPASYGSPRIFFVIFFVTAIFRNYVDAAFLKRYGPQYIPWMLVINGILTFVVMGIVDRLGRRSSDYVLLCVFLFGYAGSTIALFFVVKAGFSIAYPILYQLLYLLDTILLVYLWNMAGDLFDTRQGKRIFPLITAGQALGSTLGSFATSPFTRSFGEDPALLLFGVASFGTAIFVARTASGLLGKSPQRAGAAKSPSRVVRLTEVPGLIKHYPIVRYLMIVGLIPNVLLPIFLYQFNVIANHTFTSEQSLISFLGVFRGMTTLSTFVLLFLYGSPLFVNGPYQCFPRAPCQFCRPFRITVSLFQHLRCVLRPIYCDPDTEGHIRARDQGTLQHNPIGPPGMESDFYPRNSRQGRYACRLFAHDSRQTGCGCK